MEANILSIRPFMGAKNFDSSRAFYTLLGFEELPIDANLSLFRMKEFGFYLQRAYVKDWVDNTMLFLEVDDPESFLEFVKALQLPEKYDLVRVSEMVYKDWGMEFFLHDPSEILWHIGNFNG